MNKAKKRETKFNRIKKYRDKIMIGKGIME
ncbi:hypothetical protein [Macrococcoides canis]|nr:hypothetical protein [Macrococcus canis]